MTTTDALLLALFLVVLALSYQIQRQHRRLIRLLSDYATMIGEWFEEWEEQEDKHE